MIPVEYQIELDPNHNGTTLIDENGKRLTSIRNCVFLSIHPTESRKANALIVTPKGQFLLVPLDLIKAQVNNSGIVTPQTSFR